MNFLYVAIVCLGVLMASLFMQSMPIIELAAEIIGSISAGLFWLQCWFVREEYWV